MAKVIELNKDQIVPFLLDNDVVKLPVIHLPEKDLTKPTLYIMVGPPASGKSSYTKKLVKNYRTGRVNQDSIRDMLKGGKYEFTSKAEKIIKEVNDRAIETILEAGFDCVADNTHCNPTTLNKLLEKFKDKAVIKVIVFEVPLWKLKVRNVLRYIKTFGKTWVPVYVIENMHDKMDFIKVILKSAGYSFETIKN